MRLIELFVTEKISLTNLKNPLKREIEETILYCLHQIYYRESKLDPKIKAHADKNSTLKQVNAFIKPLLDKQLTLVVAAALTELLKGITEVDVAVKFADITASGHASGRTIVLNTKYTDDICKVTMGSLYDVALDSVENENDLVSVLFLTYKKADMYMFARSNLNTIIDNLISVIIHEMVHVVQHDKQYKAGRSTTEYRSYLDKGKDKTKFYNSLRKLSAGDHTAADYKLYRGSPQEIAAFAQEAALKFINDIDMDNLADINDLRKDLPNEMRMYIESLFNNPTNQTEHKVFKRFHKLMYQEVDRYMDAIEKKRKREARSNKPKN